jgi:hypothetical protein
MKVGDLILWHGGNTIALVIHVRQLERPRPDLRGLDNWWVTLFDEDGIFEDDLGEGFSIIDENFVLPEGYLTFGFSV